MKNQEINMIRECYQSLMMRYGAENLNEDFLSDLISASELVYLEKNKVVSEAELLQNFFFIYQGILCGYAKQKKEVIEKIYYRIGNPILAGNILDNQKELDLVFKAASDAILIKIPRQKLLAKQNTMDNFLMKAFAVCSQNEIRWYMDLQNIRGNEIATRCELFQKRYPDLYHILPKTYLASLLGMTIQSYLKCE